MITVALVEDDPILLQSYTDELSQHQDIHVVASCLNAGEARRTIIPLKPNVILIDLVLPDEHGTTLIVELHALLPMSNLMVLSAFEDYQNIFDAIRAGALGYLSKGQVGTDLAEAVRSLSRGESPISAAIARKLLLTMQATQPASPKLAELSPREREVIQLVATGLSYATVAERLCISIETVRTHIRNSYKKLQINSRKEIAAVLAVKS